MNYYPAAPLAGCVLARTGCKIRGAASSPEPTCGLDGRPCDIPTDDAPRRCGWWKPRPPAATARLVAAGSHSEEGPAGMSADEQFDWFTRP